MYLHLGMFCRYRPQVSLFNNPIYAERTSHFNFLQRTQNTHIFNLLKKITEVLGIINLNYIWNLATAVIASPISMQKPLTPKGLSISKMILVLGSWFPERKSCHDIITVCKCTTPARAIAGPHIQSRYAPIICAWYFTFVIYLLIFYYLKKDLKLIIDRFIKLSRKKEWQSHQLIVTQREEVG